MQDELLKLREENEDLKARIGELEEDKSLNKLSAEEHYFYQQIRGLLREKEPSLEQLMDLTLAKERKKQEQKDAITLDLLQQKDQELSRLYQEIEKLEVGNPGQFKLRQLERENEELRAKVEELGSLTNDLGSSQLDTRLEEQEVVIQKLNQQITECTAELENRQANDEYMKEAMER